VIEMNAIAMCRPKSSTQSSAQAQWAKPLTPLIDFWRARRDSNS
jgi:hypothetical protein